jgi:hypothetical protein
MRFARFVLGAVPLAVVIACTSSVADPVSPQAHGGPCEATGEGPGVKIIIRSASCDYDQGAPATFDYEITTTDALPPVVVVGSSTCGSCRQFSTAIAPWANWRIAGQSSAGVSQQYCLCDTGCCPPDQSATYDVEAGSFEETIKWSGRRWNGPSDTGQEEGAFFLPGRYDVEVDFARVATAKLSIVIREKR